MQIPLPPHRVRATALGIAAAVCLLGCGSEESAEPDPNLTQHRDKEIVDPQALAPAHPEPTLAAEIPLGPIGLVDETLHSEPSRQAWQGEVFNDLAGAQLKALGKHLEHPDELDAGGLEEFFIAGVDAGITAPLGSAATEDFNDGIFRIATRSGAPVASKFAALVAPLRSATDLRSKFKIFSVELDEAGSPTCLADFQISGRVGGQTLAIHAEWTCRWSWPSPEAKPLLESVRIAEIDQSSAAAGMFTDCTADALSGAGPAVEQLSHDIEHWAARLERRYGIGLSGWHGLAVGDANGDGLDDVYICEPGGLPNRLFIHGADGRVIDASSLSGTDFRLQTQSAIFADLDNDGDQDLVLATTLGIILMANDGRGNFTVKSSQLVAEAAPLSVSAADYDLDGDLDLYFGCYSLRTSNVDGVQILGRPIPYHDANNGGRNVLLRNDRDWRFIEATRELGLDENNRRFTLAASWEDYDDDGDPDLYVANDYGRNNLYRNDRDPDGNSHFTDVAAQAGVEDISAGMSVSWSDADGDGDRDLYVSNMWSSAGNRIAYQRNFLSGAADSQRAEFQRHARGNSLFINNGDGTFADAAVAAGVTMGRWAWGSRFADLNNDGLQDIVVTNGFITQPDDSGDL